MNQPRAYFSKPWGYIESISIVLGILLVSIGFEIVSEIPTPILAFPYNLFSLIILFGGSLLIHFFSRSNKTIAWFSSIPASVGAIILFLTLTLIMACVPQQNESHSYQFITNVTSSWAYYCATAYLLLVLGAVTIRRLGSFNRVNLSFFLNHAGLWITIATASLGAGDVAKYRMTLSKDTTEWRAINSQNTIQEFDFALHLYAFEKEEYPAKIACVNPHTGTIYTHNNTLAIFEADSINSFVYNDYTISVQKHLPSSLFFAHEYHPINEYGATQSYYVNITHMPTQTDTSGWISVASIIQPAHYLTINDSTTLAVLSPEAKRYASHVKVYKKNGDMYTAVIEVNKPITIDGFKLYQTGYDETKGRWSDISILEIVHDPWLPFVYFGIFLFLAGTGMIIWFGKKR